MDCNVGHSTINHSINNNSLASIWSLAICCYCWHDSYDDDNSGDKGLKMLLNKAIEKNKQRASKLEQTAQWAKHHNLDRFDDLAYCIDIYDDYVAIEVLPEHFGEARRLLGKGWKLQNTHTNSSTGSRFHSYQNKNELENEDKLWCKSVVLLEQIRGKTQCKIVQIGVKEEPVYEIVCK